jgi:hypothetical protein
VVLKYHRAIWFGACTPGGIVNNVEVTQMRLRSLTRSALFIALCGVFTPVFAQRFELNPYVGVTFPSSFFGLDVRNSKVFGLRGGLIGGNGFEIEGNLGRVSRFEFEGSTRDISALRWEAIGSYNFFPSESQALTPFVSVGIGGFTVDLEDDTLGNSAIFATTRRIARVPNGPFSDTAQTLVLTDNKTFLSLTYGGGVKLYRLWGPVGLRFTAGGQTIPKFFDHTINSLETTGGVIFSWGER